MVSFGLSRSNKLIKLAAAAVVLMRAAPCPGQNNPPHSARDYYNELKEANNFNHYKDTFVCFSDDNNLSFAVISRVSDVIGEMKKAGVSLDKAMLKSKNLLFVETYYKRISSETLIYDPLGNGGTEWSMEFGAPMHGRMVYSVNWLSGRYRLQVYALDRSKTLPAAEVLENAS